MNCILCGNRIEEDKDKVLVGCDGDFMHKKCYFKWESYKTKIRNMSDSEFYKFFAKSGRYSFQMIPTGRGDENDNTDTGNA